MSGHETSKNCISYFISIIINIHNKVYNRITIFSDSECLKNKTIFYYQYYTVADIRNLYVNFWLHCIYRLVFIRSWSGFQYHKRHRVLGIHAYLCFNKLSTVFKNSPRNLNIRYNFKNTFFYKITSTIIICRITIY